MLKSEGLSKLLQAVLKADIQDKFYKISLFVIFVPATVLRLYMYFQNPSMWVDEAALASNICSNSYKELLRGLDFLQVSPALFTIFVKTLVNTAAPPTTYLRDLVLRFIPLLCGTLAIPAFYCLVRTVFDSKKMILVSMFILAFNPCAIIYSVQMKQYSAELLTTVILLTVFYKMFILNKNKWYYSLVIAFAPWFSYSAFFIVAGGLTALLFKSRKAWKGD